MKKYKVAMIYNMPSPYRIPLFNELAKNPNIDLCVYFETGREKNREWKVEHSDLFKYKILSGISLNFARDVYYNINPMIIKELIFNKYDVIITAGYGSFSTQIAFFIAKFLKIPFILGSGSTINEPRKIRSITLPLAKLIVKYADAYVAYGTNAKKYLMHLGAPERDIFISYNTVDTDFFKDKCLKCGNRKNVIKKEFEIIEENLILYIGQFVERKGIKYLLEAHKKLCDKHNLGLLLIGNGPQKDELVELCRRENIDGVYFIDFVQKDALPQYYAIADVFVLPSTEEVWGLVINEAMACGLPVISTDKVGASIDLIKHGVNGCVIPASDVDRLYESLAIILGDSKLKYSMGRASEEIIKDFTVSNGAKRFVRAIDFVCKQSSK